MSAPSPTAERGSPAAREARIAELLVADVPTEEFLARLEALRHDAGGDGGALIVAAQRLRATIDAERRHGRAIAALNDTAADLAGTRDVDDVLRAICRRSRTLLATDVAYITLRDDARGDTYIRTTEGTVSERFARLRLPAGVGLGGMVAAQGIALATSDYFRDARFAHTSAVDASVAGEGLRAIVGVPLRPGSQIIGVLLTGSRSPRRFDPTEIALFQALATHAAIAIENARLFAAAAERHAELETSHASLDRHSRRLEAAAAMHQRLARLLAAGAGPADVLDAIGEAIDGALELADVDGAPLARRGDPGPADATVELAVSAGADPVGRLRWWSARPADTGLAAELLRGGAAILAGQLVSRRVNSEADLHERAQLVVDLFERADVDERRLDRDAARLGISLHDPHVVLLADLAEGATHWTTLRAARAAADGGAARTGDGRVLAIVAGDDASATAHAWLELLATADGGRPTIAVSRPAAGVEGLRGAHADASNALALLHALGRRGVAASVRELGLFGLVFAHTDADELDAFLERAIGPALAYDARRRDGHALVTATAYFENGGHLNNTARALGIHINTLYARLERLDQLLGAGWREGDRGLELHLALRLHALARRLADDERDPDPPTMLPHRPTACRRVGAARQDAR